MRLIIWFINEAYQYNIFIPRHIFLNVRFLNQINLTDGNNLTRPSEPWNYDCIQNIPKYLLIKSFARTKPPETQNRSPHPVAQTKSHYNLPNVLTTHYLLRGKKPKKQWTPHEISSPWQAFAIQAIDVRVSTQLILVTDTCFLVKGSNLHHSKGRLPTCYLHFNRLIDLYW